jgi:hypothetical protein
MRRNYDIFEILPDGSREWRSQIQGQFESRRKLHELAEHSKNKFLAIESQTNEILPATSRRSMGRHQQKSEETRARRPLLDRNAVAPVDSGRR